MVKELAKALFGGDASPSRLELKPVTSSSRIPLRQEGGIDIIAATMTSQLSSTGARLDTLLLRINQGQGTIGKFATDTGFYTDIRALSQSMKQLLDELQKHPGKVPVTVKIF